MANPDGFEVEHRAFFAKKKSIHYILFFNKTVHIKAFLADLSAKKSLHIAG